MRDNALRPTERILFRMSTYLILCGTVGLLMAIFSVGLAVDAADRQINKQRRRREMDELRRQARAAWERTMEQLESESGARRGRGAQRA